MSLWDSLKGMQQMEKQNKQKKQKLPLSYKFSCPMVTLRPPELLPSPPFLSLPKASLN